MRTLAFTKRQSPIILVSLTTFVLLCTPALAGEGGTTPQESPAAHSGLTILDGLVLAVYALAMLLIGYYYSRQTQSADDYLLGGRTMKPWMVGLSMFATFLSVLTYLALPGEILAHGPMTLTQILGYAIAGIVVCWVVIPYIMRFAVTSGYEILETRFGEDIRLLGAVIFLMIRFLWMGLVIYATVDKVFVPVLGLDKATVPYISAMLGLITVVYSSMGGLRAVVLSDAIQAIILVSGAVLGIVLISVNLRGFNWFPTESNPNWDTFRLWYSPTSRADAASFMTSVAFWWIATASSDQMAIQRYLSTRDVRSARRMLCLSLSVNGILACLLGLLGFALLAYFTKHPEMLAAGQTVAENADQLLPRFIVVGLPAGLSGLVIAALVAATMSSLSSGVNSASSVITTDFVGRFRKTSFTEEDRLRVARRMSWLVGAGAILLSMTAGLVEGNLFEKCHRMANLFTVPLFMLFFMAIFIPWATRLGVWAAVITSATAAIGIGHFHWGNLGFLWLTIGAMITGVIVGPSVSAVELLVLRLCRKT